MGGGFAFVGVVAALETFLALGVWGCFGGAGDCWAAVVKHREDKCLQEMSRYGW